MEISETRDININTMTELYKANEWSFVEKSNKLYNDLINSHALVSAWNLQSKLNIKELIITGCATDFYVESTIQSALTKDYNVTVVKDGHTTGECPNLKAEQIINHYNWVWQNMISTQGKLK